MKLRIKKWLLGGKKEDHRQILEKIGRISHLEKKVVRQGRAIRELQERMNRFWVQIQKLQKKEE